MFDKIVDFQLKYSKQILFVFLVLVAIMSTYAINLPIDPSFSVLVDQNSEFNTNQRIIDNSFEVNNAFTILVELDKESNILNRPTTIKDQRVIKYLQEISQVITESQYVKTITPIQFSDDEQFARVIVGVDIPRKRSGETLVINELNQYLEEIGTRPGLKTSVTGFPLLLNRVNTLLIGDNLKAILFTLTAIFLVLYWYFRNIKYSILALSIPLSSLIMLAGLMTILDIPLTITLAAVGILVLGLGIDYTIHVLLSYNLEIQDKTKPKAIHAAVDHLSKAIAVSYATTAAGFAALMFGISPSSQSQGIVLVMGITVIFLITILIIPTTLNLFANNKKITGNLIFRKIKAELVKLSQYQAKHPKKIIFIITILTIIFIIGASNIQISTSNNNWIPDNDPISRDFRTSAFAFGTDFDQIAIVLIAQKGDFRDVQKVRDIQNLQEILLSHKNINEIRSPFNDLELDPATITTTLNSRNQSFNNQFTLAQIQIIANDLGSDESGESQVFDDIIEIVNNNPILHTSTSFYGDTVRFRELGISLGRDTGITTMISFILVFIIASIAYYSLRVGIIALIPVIIGIIWTVGIMGFMGVPFTALSTGLIALVLGIGVDFSIHLVNSIYNYLNQKNSLNDSLKKTLEYTGTPILLSSITTFIGFSSLLFATLLGIKRLGISLAISILSVFLVTIILVPAIISLAQKLNKK